MTTVTVPPQYIKTKSDEAAVAVGCTFDEAAGLRVCEFFQFLRMSKGQWAGKPFELLDWQRNDLIMPLFGWKNPDGTRRFRIAYLEVAKKNGKSTISSGLSLYLATADDEPGAEVYNAAADREQAGIVFNESVSMIKGTPGLLNMSRITTSKKRIDFPTSNSFIRAISSEAYTAEGLNIHGLIFDELHAQKSRELWDALRYGGDARRQPLIISITTAGWDTTTICYEQHEYASKVLSGDIIDTSFFPLIYAADKEDDILSPETWKKANPSLGITMQESNMETYAKEALASPVKLNSFLRYKLNIWTAQAERWLMPEDWQKCTEVKDPIAWRKEIIEKLAGKTCYAGLDLASVSDMTALVLWFPEDNILLPWFWCPESVLHDNENANRNLYDTWSRQGFLTITPGNVADYDFIRKDINDLAEKFSIKEIAADLLFQGMQLCNQLTADGLEVIVFRQGFISMTTPSKEFERRVLSAQFEHGNNPILNWHASNVTIATDPAGNIKPVKPNKNGPLKIDGIVCAIMALGRIIQTPEEGEFDGTLTII